MKPGGLDSVFHRLALLALLLAALGFYVTPLSDGDSWWHLASGRFIVETGSLPVQDPLGVYDTINYWGETVLKGQWLGQAALFGAWRAGDLTGVVLLRAGLMLACLLTLLYRCPPGARAGIATVLFLFLAAMTLRGHLSDRPQNFSFAFFALMLVFLERFYRDAGKRSLYLLPPLFLLWANTHPGVLLGMAVLVLFTALYAVEQRLLEAKALFGPHHRPLYAVAALCGLATITTPNSITSYEYLFRLQASEIQGRIAEYQSPFVLLGHLGDTPFLAFYAVLCLAALALLAVLVRRRKIVEAGLVAFLVAVSFDAYRYVPFMVICTAPILARHLGPPLERGLGRARAWVLAGAALLFLALLVNGTLAGKAFRGGFAEDYYPVALAGEVKRGGYQGRIFNSLGWGGFLTWTLPSTTRVFVDGRLMDSDRVARYTHILWQTEPGRRFFEEGEFSLVLIAHRNPAARDAQPYPLIEFLRRDPRWRLVSNQAIGVLFARADG